MNSAGDSADGAHGGLVCVTGGSGFIGSWLVRLFLNRGYTVHATVKNIEDEDETKHLQVLDGAGTRLRLFQMDLLDPASIRPAVDGARGIFHLASPVLLQTQDPERELLEPAVKGTLNVLRAAKDYGLNRVVLMSSKAAMVPNHNWLANKIYEDDCWADLEQLKKLQFWYGVSKTLAEKAAWEFATEMGLQLVVLNPAMVLGPFSTPTVNANLNLLLQLLGGQRIDLDLFTGCVDVRDVALSLITLHENPSAQGRYLCLWSLWNSGLTSQIKLQIFTLNSQCTYFIDATLSNSAEFPSFHIRIKEDKQGWVVRAKDPSKKLIDLGIHFTPFDTTIRETVDCFRSKGLI